MSNNHSSVEQAVLNRYAQGAAQRVDALCCPVEYDRRLLEAIPQEIIERDYGCGDPSQFVRAGEVVLDLGSGAGKIAYIAAQLAGAKGRVIGVDFNPPMLALARKYQAQIAAKLGFGNVEFRRGKVQDLALDLELLDRELAAHPVKSSADVAWLNDTCERLRRTQPLIADNSVDLVLSNCVLNLVHEGDKRRLFSEIFRVVKPGGRVAISDIVSDEPVPDELKRDPELWSGCISGAFEENEFLHAFALAGFDGIELAKRDEKPWRTVQGIEFRAVTVTAHKADLAAGLELNQALIYRGPFVRVEDEHGHVWDRGARQAVSDKQFTRYQREPYGGQFFAVAPNEPVTPALAQLWNEDTNRRRHPRETKGQDYDATTEAGGCCEPGKCC